jgi:hypothetical protein
LQHRQEFPSGLLLRPDAASQQILSQNLHPFSDSKIKSPQNYGYSKQGEYGFKHQYHTHKLTR